MAHLSTNISVTYVKQFAAITAISKNTVIELTLQKMSWRRHTHNKASNVIPWFFCYKSIYISYRLTVSIFCVIFFILAIFRVNCVTENKTTQTENTSVNTTNITDAIVLNGLNLEQLLSLVSNNIGNPKASKPLTKRKISCEI